MQWGASKHQSPSSKYICSSRGFQIIPAEARRGVHSTQSLWDGFAAPWHPSESQGTHLAAGMGAFSPCKGVETVLLVLTTLFDAGPSSQPILMGQGYFYLASALFHQLIELVDFGTAT